MNTYGRIFQHLLHEYFLTGSTYMLAHKVGRLHPLFHFVGNHISPVTSRKSHHKGEISFLNSGNADFQVFLYLQRNVIFWIFGWFSVLVRINTEKGKVACVTRPHPVVGICTEFADGRRRSAYHTNITVHRFDEHIIFVSSVKSLELQFCCRSYFYVLCFGETFCHGAQITWWQVVDTFRVRIFFQLLVDVIGHIQNPVDKCNGQSRSRKFRVTVHSPETICQVVMFYITVLLDSSVTTVVIR